MAATDTQINNYILSIRTAIAEYGGALAIKQQLGKTDTYCDRVKLMLLSAYLDCMSDYFTTGASYATTNFFTIAEARDVMQHINNICGTFYILDL